MIIKDRHWSRNLLKGKARIIISQDNKNLKVVMMKKKIVEQRKGEGDIGIGTMIIFIALVLVSAIAASLLITTAGRLNQQAQDTAEIARQEIATGLLIRNMAGDRLVDGQGATAVMPTLDSTSPTPGSVSVTAIGYDPDGLGGNHTDGDEEYYGYKILVTTAPSDSGSGILKVQLYRSPDNTYNTANNDTLIKTWTDLAGNLPTAGTVAYDAPPSGRNIYFYYLKVYDKAGNVAYSTPDTSSTRLTNYDTVRPSAPTLAATGSFTALSRGPNSGTIQLVVTDLDLSSQTDTLSTSNAVWNIEETSDFTSLQQEYRIRGFNVYRSTAPIPPGAIATMQPIGFWDINDFTVDENHLADGVWYDYIQKTGGSEKTAYYYALAAVDLTGNEGNSYHSDGTQVSYGLVTSAACAASCTNDIVPPTFSTYTVTATASSMGIIISWVGEAADSGSGMAYEDFTGSVMNQQSEHYAYEIWRSLEPIYKVEQLPVNGRVNPLVKLAGYATGDPTNPANASTFIDYGIDFLTGSPASTTGNTYYYAVVAVDNAGNRAIQPGLSVALEVIEIKVTLAAGSPPVDFDMVSLDISDGSRDVALTYGGIGTPADATSTTFTVEVVRDIDGTFIEGNILTPGSVVKIYINAHKLDFNLLPQTHVTLHIRPKHGVPAYESFITPSTYVDRYVELL
ncbi:MAG TPA: hypothetical protein ENF69_05385 [Euryarchaeota archaeon]|nr:hypothetical protein [Euryarchaeota archaeon]